MQYTLCIPLVAREYMNDAQNSFSRLERLCLLEYHFSLIIEEKSAYGPPTVVGVDASRINIPQEVIFS